MADFKIFKISLLASSAIIAPIGTILVQNEYADLDEEEPEEENDDSDDEEIEAPTIVTVRSQKEAIDKRRALYRDNEKFQDFLRKQRETVVATRIKNGLPILKPLDLPSPTQVATEVPTVSQPAPEITPVPQPRTESEVVAARVASNNPSGRQATARRRGANVVYQRVGRGSQQGKQVVWKRRQPGQTGPAVQRRVVQGQPSIQASQGLAGRRARPMGKIGQGGLRAVQRPARSSNPNSGQQNSANRG